jgi:DNA repair protein RadD
MSLRWYQDEAVESVFDYFRSGKTGNPIIALPTGTGKSHVIGGIQQRALGMWPNQRFINLTHVKELVEQNAKKMLAGWPNAPIGINSAGLKQRDVMQAVIFAGIASVAKNPHALGHRDLALIDECHLVSPKGETMYGNVLDALRDINPHLKVVGLTATKYRLGQGLLTNGDGIFTDICYDMTDIDGFARLLAEGYLAPLFPKRTITELDVSNVGMSNGDFTQNALQAAVDKQDVTYKALLELCEAGWDRKSWLIFASGVDHAEHIAEMLCNFGIPATAVHSKIKAKERDARLNGFKRGDFRCVVNNNVLTTGFDHPPVDLIGMFRPTISPGLWVQMLGRGTRPWSGGYIEVEGVNVPWGPKTDCLVLDFAGNTKRLGPINDPQIPKKKSGAPGDAPVRICDACGTYNHASAAFCMCCGVEFPRSEKISSKASTEELIRSDAPVVNTYDVTRVMYHKHVKRGAGAVSLRADYYSGIQRFSEWVHFEKGGLPGRKAKDWWRQRHQSEPPTTVEEALLFVSQLRAPRRIRVWTNKKYPEILSYEY